MNLTVGKVLIGPAGTATEVLVALERDDPIAYAATVDQWLLDCPGQSPAWRHYLLSIIHLRPIVGVRPPRIDFPHASHEVMLFALDPLENPTPLKVESWQFLHPVNVIEQVQLPDDPAALELLAVSAQAVVDGILPAEPPFSGAIEPWHTVLIRTAAHIRGESHAS